MKNEEEKNEEFFWCAKNIELILFRIFEHCWFQICAQIFHIYLGSKVTALSSGWKTAKTAKKGKIGPTLKGCNFWSKIDMKNLSTDSESAMFKYCKKYQFNIFGAAEKFFIFSCFIFHLQFSIFEKNLINWNILLKIVFPTVYNFLM